MVESVLRGLGLPAGKNEAWLMAGDTLYSVDLSSGKATEAAKISGVTGTVKDIAIVKM